MKIHLRSDLHLEFSDINIKNNGADVLILGGDICIAQDMHDHSESNPTGIQENIAWGSGLSHRLKKANRFRDFFKRCSDQFEHVIYIMGNHEFYHGKFYASIDHMREECLQFPNVYMLENNTKVIDDVVFVGGTLWTDMNKHDPLTMHGITGMMTDFRVIRNDHRDYAKMSTLDVVRRHKDTLEYFGTVLDANQDKKCVVVGHHSPSHRSVHPRYINDRIMNGAYHSDLSEFILDRPQVKLWTHGHCHNPHDYHIGDTRIVCNPRGYEGDGYSEDTGWDPNLILEV